MCSQIVCKQPEAPIAQTEKRFPNRVHSFVIYTQNTSYKCCATQILSGLFLKEYRVLVAELMKQKRKETETKTENRK